ncbi:MAG: TIGR04222 domain-containing membrane protein [Sphingomonadaceae bacterium]|nr:TIGR04222 domain-containing membrane protein [Sphingomonadaceae bacterium]
MNPFDWTGGPFLMLYVALLVGAITAGFAIPAWLRPQGNSRRIDDPEEMAVLTGGKKRHAEVVASSLLARGGLEMLDKRRMAPGKAQVAKSSAERAVSNLVAPISFGDIGKAIALDSEAIEQRLIDRGQMMESGTAWQMRIFQTLPYLALMVFGYMKLEIGLSRDKPVGFLAILLIITALIALVRFFYVNRSTKGGIEAVKYAQSQSDRLRRAPTGEETATAVALFGTAVLVGTPFSDFHTMRQSSTGGDSGSCGSDGGGDGGGGCGGGCGGCGG